MGEAFIEAFTAAAGRACFFAITTDTKKLALALYSLLVATPLQKIADLVTPHML